LINFEALLQIRFVLPLGNSQSCEKVGFRQNRNENRINNRILTH